MLVRPAAPGRRQRAAGGRRAFERMIVVAVGRLDGADAAGGIEEPGCLRGCHGQTIGH